MNKKRLERFCKEQLVGYVKGRYKIDVSMLDSKDIINYLAEKGIVVTLGKCGLSFEEE